MIAVDASTKDDFFLNELFSLPLLLCSQMHDS